MMATHEVDVTIACRLALHSMQYVRGMIPANAIREVVGLSWSLREQLLEARRRRHAGTLNEPKSIDLIQHIIWLAREGLQITEHDILPGAPGIFKGTYFGIELEVFAAKLRASFFHVFCLYHNRPAITHDAPSPRLFPSTHPNYAMDDIATRIAEQDENRLHDVSSRSSRHHAYRQEGLKDLLSKPSEGSLITNPYSNPALTPPPGLTASTQSAASFLLPQQNFRPFAAAAFKAAAELAMAKLPGSAPLRLTVQLEHCAFLWDCEHDYEGSRRLARQTIRAVYDAQEGLSDAEFNDSAALVASLAKFMKRKDADKTTPSVTSTEMGQIIGGDLPRSPESGTTANSKKNLRN